MGYREDAEAPTRNAIGEVLPDAATPSIIAELHESCKQRARFPRLLEYWWRYSWFRYARAAALMRGCRARRHRSLLHFFCGCTPKFNFK